MINFESNDTTYLSTATYSCAEGYNLNGTATVVCESDGHWNGTANCVIEGSTDNPTMNIYNIFLIY